MKQITTRAFLTVIATLSMLSIIPTSLADPSNPPGLMETEEGENWQIVNCSGLDSNIYAFIAGIDEELSDFIEKQSGRTFEYTYEYTSFYLDTLPVLKAAAALRSEDSDSPDALLKLHTYAHLAEQCWSVNGISKTGATMWTYDRINCDEPSDFQDMILACVEEHLPQINQTHSWEVRMPFMHNWE